jgi:methyl-accepting chemotaxis protein
MNIPLSGLRDLVARHLVGLTFFHVPLLALASALLGGQVMAPVAVGLLLAAVSLFAYRWRGAARTTQYVIIAALIGQVSILVAIFAGHPWQPDMHMYYFAALAVFAGFCDWRPIVLGAALIALHHLALQLVLPSAVFYQGGDIYRVLLHAVIVLVETFFLGLVATMTERIFAANETNLAEARAVAERERQLRERKRELMVEAQARADHIRAMVAEFQNEMNGVMVVLDRAAEDMQHNAHDLTGASDDARRQVMVLAESSTETTRSIEHTASASQQLAISIAEIGRNVTQSADSSQMAAKLARAASSEIEVLASTGESVGAVVEIIRGIAAQTSLLALNATIEAARAGAMGKGFAVVANEVKALASQTATATAEVAQSIEAIQSASQRSLKAMREIVEVVGDVETVSVAIAYAVSEQDRATAEIAREVQVSSDGAGRTAQMLSAVESVTVRTFDAAGRLQSSSDDLASQTHRIRAQVSGFCEKIAAA